MDYLTIIANVASILTAVFAAWAWIYYRLGLSCKRQKLEAYLRGEKTKASDKGERSILHLMARLGMTEAEILQASFRSKRLKRLIATNPTNNRAEAILLRYDESAAP